MDEKFSASPVYQRTIEKGIAIGEAKGKEISRAIGEAQAKAQILTQARLKITNCF